MIIFIGVGVLAFILLNTIVSQCVLIKRVKALEKEVKDLKGANQTYRGFIDDYYA